MGAAPRSLVALLLAAAAVTLSAAQTQEGFHFRSGVELINVTATVTDGRGRFVSGLERDDFTVYEDGERQEVTHFSNERVPVSLGIALDASGSMTPDKMSAARTAIDRFVHDLLGEDDEIFILRFSHRPDVVQPWTTDRQAVSRAVARIAPGGGTALYDAVADAVPIADSGRHTKKALLIISDGNDTSSSISVGALQRLIRESEVLVYPLGVDGTSAPRRRGPTIRLPIPLPFPIPGRGQRRPPIIGGGTRARTTSDRVNAAALRDITDDTGGRTEIVRGFGDLDDATSRIADELSRQYYLGYVSPVKNDGRWHAIKVKVKNRELAVRARRGYVAS